MKVPRLDLDGTGSPMGLVTKILQTEKTLPIPVPIEELAIQLDIEEIAALETEGFEGGLLTDEHRASGIILVNEAAQAGRRRFTIGHELGHFLMLTHKPVEAGKFLCSREDMRRWTGDQNDRYARMEIEANQFSALLLMPPPVLRKFIQLKGNPDLQHVMDLAKHFNVSKEAAARAYAQYHSEKIAIVVTHNDLVIRAHKSVKFPRICIPFNTRVPAGSVYHRRNLLRRAASDVVDTVADTWIDVEYGQRAPELFEQVYLQQSGFALILLWVEMPEEEDDVDDDRTSKQRLQDRLSRYR
jgi:Zn-dependent peptidase ImmA (M78 family)